MKENNNIEQFDELFKQQLENASTPVPNGVWEGISSSIGTGTGAATIAVKTAFWMKAAITASVIGVVSLVTYQVINEKGTEPVPVRQPVIIEKSAPQEEVSPNVEKQDEAITVPDAGTQVAKHEEHLAKAARTHKNAKKNEVQAETQSPADIKFFEIKDEVSMQYVNKMNDNVVPKFDSSKMEKAGDEEKTEIPYVPEKESVAYQVDSSFIYIPNVFTPNGDGVNDGYQIDIKGEEYVQIIIYNNKSVKIFETRNKNVAWDGRMPNGEIAPEGNYIVKVIYKFKNKAQTTATTKLKLIK